MKTILQQTETAFHAISIQDAITMTSLMDTLAEEFRTLYNQVHEPVVSVELQEEYHLLGEQLIILAKLGFRTSVPGMLQFDPEEFPEATSLD